MRLTVVLEQCLAPVPGGTGRYSREIAAALARTAGAGVAGVAGVSGVVAWHRDVTAATVPGVGGPTRFPLPRRALVAAWERGLGPRPAGDVVLAPTPLHPPPRRPPGTAAAAPTVVVVHDAVPWTHPETLTPRGVAWHRAQVARAGRDAALVVVPTRAVADELGRHVALRTPVLVVGEGVSADLAVPADADARAQRLALPERYLLTVATLEPRKGLDVLLAALALPSAPDLPLLCVGQGGWGGVQVDPGRARRMGRVSDPDLAVLLDRATAVVVPSRAEGFGLPLLEAMAAGTPAITSDAPALVEVGGGAARTTPLEAGALAEALAEVVGDDALRARMSAAGRARAAAYTWDGAAGLLWTALRSV